MSENQKIPKGPLALAIIFILLFVDEAITVAFLPGMPPVFWAIGGTFLILGIIILIYFYRKYKGGGYIETPDSEKVAIHSIDTDISDWKIFKSNLIVAIVLFIITSILIGLALHPFSDRTTRITNIVVGVLLIFGAILNIIIFLIKPKKRRQKYLEKRAKKAAKKGN